MGFHLSKVPATDAVAKKGKGAGALPKFSPAAP
jgi:hypothetical protein